MNPTIIMLPSARKEAERIAKLRCYAKDKSFRNNDIEWCDDERWKPHYIGCLGELAVSHVLDLEMDKKALPGGDDYDFLMHGMKIEVKTRRTKRCDLAVYEWEKKSPDIYIFCHLHEKENKVEILGKITKKAFQRAKELKEYNNGKAKREFYTISPDKLVPFRSIYCQMFTCHG